MLKDFFEGINAYFKAFAIISKHRLWYFCWVAGFISLVLGSILGYLAWQYTDNFGDLLVGFYPQTWWGYAYVAKIVYIFSGILLFIAAFLLFRTLLLPLIAPFMSPLAAKVLAIETGAPVTDPNLISGENMRLILRGGALSLRNMLKELFFTGLLLILGLFPLFSLITVPLIFLVQAFYAGFGNMDYTLERRYNIAESKAFSKQYRALTVGNGVVFLLLLAIPVLGFLLAPALSVVAATLVTHKRTIR